MLACSSVWQFAYTGGVWANNKASVHKEVPASQNLISIQMCNPLNSVVSSTASSVDDTKTTPVVLASVDAPVAAKLSGTNNTASALLTAGVFLPVFASYLTLVQFY